MIRKLLIYMPGILFLAFFSCGNKKDPAKEGYDLKIQVEKGKKYDLQVGLDLQMEMKVGELKVNTATYFEVGMDYVVTEVKDNGNIWFKETIKRIKAISTDPESTSEYDSQTGETSGLDGLALKTEFSSMIGEYTEIEMNPKGDVIRVKSPGEENNQSDALQFVRFPDKKIKPGESWDAQIYLGIMGSPMNSTTSFTLVSVKNNMAEITLKGTFDGTDETKGKFTGTHTGFVLVDIQTGLIMQSELTQVANTDRYEEGVAIPTTLTIKTTTLMK